LGSQTLFTVIVFLNVASSVSNICIVELFAGTVMYCIFWLVLPLSVTCVVVESIIYFPTPSANIGNLPAVFSGKYILFDDISAFVESCGFTSSSK